MKSQIYNVKYDEFIKKLRIGNGKYNPGSVFEDLILMFTISIKNRYDYNQKDEDVYLSIINKYEKEEQMEFCELAGKLMLLYIEQEEISDILGEIYFKLNLANNKAGQVFTPFNISRFIAEVTDPTEELKNRNTIKILDPACGSGSLSLAFVSKYKDKIEDFSDRVLFVAQDLDFRCVCMTFIQFAMNGVAAKVILGNTLTNEERKVFYTPKFFEKNWFEKLKNYDNKEDVA